MYIIFFLIFINWLLLFCSTQYMHGFRCMWGPWISSVEVVHFYLDRVGEIAGFHWYMFFCSSNSVHMCLCVDGRYFVDEVSHLFLFLWILMRLSKKPHFWLDCLLTTWDMIFNITLLLPDPFSLSYIYRFEEETKNHWEEGCWRTGTFWLGCPG